MNEETTTTIPAGPVGILHPGAMGISVAAAVRAGGREVWWASGGRSAATQARAAEHAVHDAGTLAALCAACPVVISVCPPHAAEALAEEVTACGFRGIFLDANAIAPERAQRINAMMTAAGITFVDGGIIGPPAWMPGTTLYLSGPCAAGVARCFSGSALETCVLGDEIGTASALKMCYAAYSKGTTALLAAVQAAAEGLGVREALLRQWNADDPAFGESAGPRMQRVTAKAWRFAGEMREIAATMRAAGVPGEFHDAAAEVYERMAPFKGAAAVPALADVLAALREPREG